jgi:N-methylhydantoinase A
VIGASYVAQICELPRCMSLDIGGTSADVALIMDGQPQYGAGERIGDFQIFVPSVSVSSIGEGGGSIASVDKLGILKVGPESASSRPGPACYGRGGTRPTITDAFAACGMVGLAEIGYAAVAVDRGRARDAIAPLAEQLRLTVEATAEAIIRIAVSGMYSDVSSLVSRFGVDPRQFACLAFGGAGPMMACFLARELGMKEIVVPPAPGVLSAMGGLIADLKSDFLQTLYLELDDAAASTVRTAFGALEARALTWLRQDQGYEGAHGLSYSAEMRYRGQAFELDTPIDAQSVASADRTAMAEAFHTAHEQVYGHADRHAPVQLIAIRLVISGQTAKPELPRHALQPGPAPMLRLAEVWMDGQIRQVGLYRRADLLAGQSFPGPAVVTQDDCTTVVPPGFTAIVDAYTNLRITPEAVA